MKMRPLILAVALAMISLTACKDGDVDVRVTGITLNKATTTILVGNSEQLSVAEVLPDNATDKSVTWSSHNVARATVDQTGLVSVLSTATVGTVEITVTANDGSGVKASCIVTVGLVGVTEITLNKTTTTIPFGESEQLSVTGVLPSNAADKSVTWSSSNTARATVDQTGLVSIPSTATVGTVDIVATANDNTGVTATCTVTVTAVMVTGITLNKTTTTIAVGGSEQLSVTGVLPTNATDKSVTWNSGNPARATVDQTGLVTIPSTATEGTVEIIATAHDGSGVAATCTVTVTPPVAVTAITLNKTATTIDVHESEQLSVTGVQPSDASDPSVTWSSSDEAVATVDEATGAVTVSVHALTNEMAVITATANDGSGVTASCTVTVGGVSINNIVWATCNVDAPGTFAALPESPGLLYQWGKNTGWPLETATVAWPDAADNAVPWEAVNDPCPAGWRVPSAGELGNLVPSGSVTCARVMAGGLSVHQVTEVASGRYIYLREAGRILTDGSYGGISYSAEYWSSASAGNKHLYFDSTGVREMRNARGLGCALAVRCVRQ